MKCAEACSWLLWFIVNTKCGNFGALEIRFHTDVKNIIFLNNKHINRELFITYFRDRASFDMCLSTGILRSS